MSVREYKRPVSLILLVVSLVLIATGFMLWLGPHGHGNGFRQTPEFQARVNVKDIHLYGGFVFMAAMVFHLACNWKTMLRHLGLRGDETKSPKSLNTPPQQ